LTPQSPQDFLNKLLKIRGYSTDTYLTLNTGYYCKPTSLQVASYGVGIVQTVRDSDPICLGKFLSKGLSPNPCNKFGESLVHMVCRRREHACLATLIKFGCSIQVSDDFGRTPLHDACWTSEPCFTTVEILLNIDRRLLSLADRRGSLPLSYARREHWGKWINFLDKKKDLYWPHRDISVDGVESPPELTQITSDNNIPDPVNACSIEMALQLSSGLLNLDSIQNSYEL